MIGIGNMDVIPMPHNWYPSNAVQLWIRVNQDITSGEGNDLYKDNCSLLLPVMHRKLLR